MEKERFLVLVRAVHTLVATIADLDNQLLHLAIFKILDALLDAIIGPTVLSRGGHFAGVIAFSRSGRRGVGACGSSA
ncbi:hypothetical protein PG993_014917 [Apiospora rasikravindrae]|uniref:Secreted protein n=1 Tax=Apiospora rasikravindrae TaxID=990691 RepID=A0ABR1RR82_9PEZI